MLLGTTASRMQGRVEACLERSGSAEAAVTGPGIGIGYLFARDIVRACERGEEQIERLRAGVEQMLANEQAGGDGWWKGWEMLKAAYSEEFGKEDQPNAE